MASLAYYSSNITQKTGLRFYGKRMYYNELMKQNQDNYLDLWYSKPLYGKIDTNFNPVECAAAKLELLGAAVGNERNYAIDFVADAFNAMRAYIQSMHLRGKLRPGAFFYPLQARGGWVSTNDLYRGNIDRVYELFRNHFLNARLQRKLTNRSITKFDNYLPVLVEFLNNMTSRSVLPLTRSGFILKKNPYSASGLMIEIARERDASNDKMKYDKYFSNPQFSTYVDIAASFGFYIDMNMPWRLVANLESPAWKKNDGPLKQILDNRFEGEYTSQRVFDQYYYRPDKVDFEEFKLLALTFYNTFVDKDPSFDVTKVCFKKPSMGLDPLTSVSKVKSKKIYRDKISMEEMSISYNDLFWLRLYMQLRLKELEADISQHQIKHELREIEQRYTNVGTDLTMEYISERMAFYLKQQVGKYLIKPDQKRNPLTTKPRPDIIL